MNTEVPKQQLDEGQAHVWRLDLDSSEGFDAPLAESLLSADERARADRLLSSAHRTRFILGRAFLRSILGGYLGTQPQSLRFACGPHGKPELITDLPGSPMANGGRIHFNLAHSEGLGLLAVTRNRPVGIDLERIRKIENLEGLVRQFFSPRESVEFSKLPRDSQQNAFLNLWTRKEALLKATGDGVGALLPQLEVTFLPGEPARVVSLPAACWPGSDWSLVGLTLPPGYVGALALPTRDASPKTTRHLPGSCSGAFEDPRFPQVTDAPCGFGRSPFCLAVVSFA